MLFDDDYIFCAAVDVVVVAELAVLFVVVAIDDAGVSAVLLWCLYLNNNV